MSKKLNLEDRYYISMYSRRLPCTLQLRFAIDDFLEQITITADEVAQYEIDIDKNTMEFKCNNSEYSVEFTEFPEPVLDAINTYIGMYGHEKNKENVLLQRTFTFLKKVL